MTSDSITEERPKVKGGFLAAAVARARERVAASRPGAPLGEVVRRAGAARPVRPLAEALRGWPREARILAEFKRRSPAAGPLAPGADAGTRARLYADHGAAAVSVLTDPAFDGSVADLETASSAVAVPVLRKDFLVDPYQIWESRAAGADAALALLAALSDADYAGLLEAAIESGLELLVEVHTEAEADRALASGAPLVGVNARDLATLEVSRERALGVLAGLREGAGAGIVLVAESGIRSAADVRRARAAGADAVLVGERLMRAADPTLALAELVAAGEERP